jgi:uncharacterized protein (TIGR03435 family)
MRTIQCVTLLAIVSGAAFGQGAARRPEFEVASVKPAEHPGANMQVSVGLHIDGAQVRFTYCSVKDLLGMAYRMRPYQVEGPEWIASERFDISAKLPAGAKREQVPEMLQALLAERFGLTLHHGTKDAPVLALVVAKGGSKLKELPADPDAAPAAANVDVAASGGPSGVSVSFGKGSYYTFANNRFEAKRMSMAMVAMSLERYETDPVMDMTGLSGVYDFVLELSPEDYQAMLIRSAVSAGVSLPQEALRMLDGNTADSLAASLERLGLKLERRKAPVETVIVDKGSKTPTAN